ncbi:hypothetical protein PInf_011986 [Phytophthora infestans]|nr:hypothetical protein PInf_011986 [Phytophthora infestans]
MDPFKLFYSKPPPPKKIVLTVPPEAATFATFEDYLEMKRAKMEISIRGNLVSVYRPPNKKGYKTLVRRKVVEPEWVKLWYEIMDGKFDESLWLRLNDIDRSFLSFCVHAAEILNKEFNVHLAQDHKIHFDQLKIVEGELMAGNMNKQLVDQYNGIIDQLTSTLQMPRLQGTLLKKRMARTFEQMKSQE